MSKQAVLTAIVLALPARINGTKHAVTGKPIEVDEHIAEQLIKAGAVKVESKDDADTDGDDQALGSMKKAELLELAKQLGVEASDELTKAQIVELIEAAREQK